MPPATKQKMNQTTAFIDAAREGDLTTVKLLLPHVDPTAWFGSALGLAVSRNQKDVVAFLLTDARVCNQADLKRILVYGWHENEEVMMMVRRAYALLM